MKRENELEKISCEIENYHLTKSTETVYDELKKGHAKIAIVGLEHTGLSIALEFGKDMNVIAFDVNEEKIEMMRNDTDPSGEISPEWFDNKRISFTSNSKQIENARVYIVAVPTPVDESNAPNLKGLKKATLAVAKCLKRGDYVIFESTVYPGCTEEICLPILESISGLNVNTEFKMGYSPERINQGDKSHPVTAIKKIVSGSDTDSCREIAKIYGHIINAGVYQAPSISVAEAAKVVENTQRDVNIALMNELAMIFDKMDIDTLEVLKAAGTKWNFLDFNPGLVGGQSIGVDPYYLIHKARKLKVDADVIKSSRMVNDWMPYEIVHRVFDVLHEKGQALDGARILIKGVTFKENVSDIRNSKAAEIANIFKMKNATVDIMDPFADSDCLLEQYDLELCTSPANNYDIVILAVCHWQYQELTTADLKKYFTKEPLIFDVKGIMPKDDKVRVMTL